MCEVEWKDLDPLLTDEEIKLNEQLHGLLEAEWSLIASLGLLSLHHIPGSVLLLGRKISMAQLSLLRGVLTH